MKKLLLAGLPVLIIFMGLPFLVTLMVVMTTTAAAECRTQSSQGVGLARPALAQALGLRRERERGQAVRHVAARCGE